MMGDWGRDTGTADGGFAAQRYPELDWQKIARCKISEPATAPQILTEPW